MTPDSTFSAQPKSAVWIVGIGSPHGDDVAGWRTIDCLQQILDQQPGTPPTPASHANARHPAQQLRKAAVPHDLLDWLLPDARVHVIDACLDEELATASGVCVYRVRSVGQEITLEVARVSQPCEVTFPRLRSSSTHQFELLSVLELAAALGQLPRELWLWTVAVQQPSERGVISTEVAQRISECARRIAEVLSHA
jgi:hydrogenase maturation protease